MIFKIYKLKILAKYKKLKQKVIKLSKKILQKYNNIYNQIIHLISFLNIITLGSG